MDSSSANKGQMVKVPIGPGDEGGQGLVAGQGRGGTVAEPVIVPVPLGVNKALSAGVAPRAADGGLATQALAASFKDAPTVGTKFRIVIPPELGFGKENLACATDANASLGGTAARIAGKAFGGSSLTKDEKARAPSPHLASPSS